MNDVLTPTGGYLPVRIDVGGYILEGGIARSVVHRETRGLDPWFTNLDEAKNCEIEPFYDDDILAILELTSDGGGSAIWISPDLRSETEHRLSRFKGCYGAWPVHSLSI